MALRGPDGMESFHRVITFLREEQNSIYNSFMTSVFCYFASTCCLVWVYPSSKVTNWAMMVCFATFLIMVVIVQVGLEVRIGGSILSHEGLDGRIRGLGTLEAVDDLDNNVGSALPDA